MSPKLSIIIPVYNTEPYLRECLDSVINQTFKDIEIIIVNDCSPDNSEDIILEYQQKDPRIILVDLSENIGLLRARIEGYKKASGQFIQSLDSDDSLDLNACEIIYQNLIKHNADIYHIGALIYKHPNKNSLDLVHWSEYDRHMFTPKDLILNQQEWLVAISSGNLDNCIWSYIISKSIIQQLILLLSTENHINFSEDFLQIFTIAFKIPVNKIVSISQQLYFYRCGAGMTTSLHNINRYPKQLTDILIVMNYILTFADSYLNWDIKIQNNFNYYIYLKTHEQIDYFLSLSLINKKSTLSTLSKNNLQTILILLISNYINTKSYPIKSLSTKEQKWLKIFHIIKNIFNKILPYNSIFRKIIINIIKKIFTITKKCCKIQNNI